MATFLRISHCFVVLIMMLSMGTAVANGVEGEIDTRPEQGKIETFLH